MGHVVFYICTYSLAMFYESNLIFNSIQNNGECLRKFSFSVFIIHVSCIDRAFYRDKNEIVLAEGQFEHYLHTSLLEVWDTVTALKIVLKAFEKDQDGHKMPAGTWMGNIVF